MNVTKEEVMQYMAEFNVSLSEARRQVRRLKARQAIKDAKTVDDLKEVLQYILSNMPY